MYIWAFGIGDSVYYGRTWYELLEMFELIYQELDLFGSKYLVCYVHNLGYEFQFMRKYFDWKKTFAIGERKPINARTETNIEFRDSYILSGYSLENTAKYLEYSKVEKLVGDLDYDLIRHQETPLTVKEMEYVNNDVEIILAYIDEQINLAGDITKIPMTNTGRVRTRVRNACYFTDKSHKKSNQGKYSRYRKLMAETQLTSDDYIHSKQAFMGGFTHANANHSGKILEEVTSIDFGSSYPSVMVTEKFPMGTPEHIEVESVEEIERLMEHKAILFTMKLENVESVINQENLISENKCLSLENPIIDNGRVFSADTLIMNVTETDYKLYKMVYKWSDISVANVKVFGKDYLPKDMILSILGLYQDKTELKDVKGREVEYNLGKGMLNSVYGMSVTDVVKDNHVYNSEHEWELEQVEVDEEIEKLNNSKNRFLYYPWGVWVTAYARFNLWTGILAMGDDYVYSDTDAIKFLNHEDHKEYINMYNDMLLLKQQEMCRIQDIDINLLTPETVDGIVKPLGVWEYEGTYSRFKTLGAKRYLQEENGKLALTVAGLSKANGLNYMLEQANNDNTKVFNMFDNELYIPRDKTGKMTHTYIDEEQSFYIEDFQGVSAPIRTLSSIHLESTDFTLSISKEYSQFLEQLIQGFKFGGVKYE